MTKKTEKQRITIGAITTVLHGTSIESKLNSNETLTVEFRAMGHRFRFQIEPDGTVTERACIIDHIGVLTQGELTVLCALTPRNIDVSAPGADLDQHDDIYLTRLLASAQRKLAVAIETGGFLSDDERQVLSQALTDYRAGVHQGCEDPDQERLLCNRVGSIERKLGV